MNEHEKTDQVLRHVMVEFVLKIKAEQDLNKVDRIITETIPRFMRAINHSKTLLSEKDVVTRYPTLFNLNKLRQMRTRGTGPKFIKFGKARNARVYYRTSAIEDWILEHEHTDAPLQTTCRPT